jgi:hypothetical protein
MKKVLVTVAALAALAVGGSALAQAGSNQSSTPAQPATSKAQAPESTTESNAPENSATDTDNVQDESGKDANEPNDANETSDANEAPEGSGPDVAGDDGPGGHADEPGNPNADHQNEGQE